MMYDKDASASGATSVVVATPAFASAAYAAAIADAL